MTSNSEEWIKERHEREKPCRTLFVRNVYYNCTVRELEEVFSRYGTVREVYGMINKRGIAFVSFYDLRHAITAKKQLNQWILNGRRLDVHFSLPRETLEPSTKCDQNSNQGTLFIMFDGEITICEIRNIFKKYGEIREIIQNSKYIIFLEFFDSRCCRRAVEVMNNFKFGGTLIQCEYAWDKSTKQTMASKTVDLSRLKSTILELLQINLSEN